MALVLTMEEPPKLKLIAFSNSTFRQFAPIRINKAVPTDLATYTWQAHLQVDKLHPTTKLFALSCTPTADGVWLVADEADLDALFTAPNDALEKRVIYGNLLFNQPGMTGVYCVAATIEMTVKAGATEWT
jgi:hypothetical protein